jgi:hypothetical protein
MDFIERWLNVAPDGGDGSLEAMIVGVAVFVIGAIILTPRLVRMIRNRSVKES